MVAVDGLPLTNSTVDYYLTYGSVLAWYAPYIQWVLRRSNAHPGYDQSRVWAMIEISHVHAARRV